MTATNPSIKEQLREVIGNALGYAVMNPGFTDDEIIELGEATTDNVLEIIESEVIDLPFPQKYKLRNPNGSLDHNSIGGYQEGWDDGAEVFRESQRERLR